MCAGSKPGIDRHQRDEAAEQQAGADRQRHGQRHFGDDQRGARAPPERAADGAAAVLLQRRLRRDARAP